MYTSAQYVRHDFAYVSTQIMPRVETRPRPHTRTFANAAGGLSTFVQFTCGLNDRPTRRVSAAVRALTRSSPLGFVTRLMDGGGGGAGECTSRKYSNQIVSRIRLRDLR